MLDDVRDDMAMGESTLAHDDIDAMDSDTLRKAVRDYVEQNATSYKAVGLVAGIAESTFTAWMGDKYKGDNEDKEAKVRKWLRSERALGRRRLIVSAESRFAATSTALRIMGHLEHAQAMPTIAVITGGAGIGKSTAVKRYKETHSNVWVLTAEPCLSSAFAMLEYLREELGIPQVAPHKLSRAICLKLANTQGLIVFDEFQHMDTKCIDQMRSLYDRAGVGIAFVGNEQGYGRIDGGGQKPQFAQLHSRVGTRANIAKSTSKDIDLVLDCAEVADAMQRRCLREVAARPGALRTMTHVLTTARMVAAGDKTEMTAEHLDSAWRRLRDGTVVS